MYIIDSCCLVAQYDLRNFPISWLSLDTGLWVVIWGKTDNDFQLMIECFSELGLELYPLIEHNFLRYLKMSLKIVSDISTAVGILGKCTRWQAFENLSVMTNMVVLPWNSVRRDEIHIWNQGYLGTGKGSKIPLGSRLHTYLTGFNGSTSLFMDVHQNLNNPSKVRNVMYGLQAESRGTCHYTLHRSRVVVNHALPILSNRSSICGIGMHQISTVHSACGSQCKSAAFLPCSGQ